MGSDNSTPVKMDPKPTRPPQRRTRPPDPSNLRVKPINLTSEKKPINNETQIQSENKLPAPNIEQLPAPNVEQLPSSPDLPKKSIPAIIIQPPISLPPENTLNNVNTSIPNIIAASSFEKAPMLQLNHVIKSSDNKSIHTYEPINITINKRTSSQSVSHGNRWYDYDYDKSINPPIIKYP